MATKSGNDQGGKYFVGEGLDESTHSGDLLSSEKAIPVVPVAKVLIQPVILS